MEVTATVVRAESIDLNDDEACFCHFRFMTIPTAPFFGDKGAVRTSVDIFDNRIFFSFLEVARTPDDSINIVFAVSVFGDETLGHLPIDLLCGLVEGGDGFLI